MDTARIAELLQPFLGPANDQRLTTYDLQRISTYIDLLLRWNARINLTAIRNEEEIVTRHFGESLFAARHLFPASTNVGADALVRPAEQSSVRLIDIGSGAGFPGLPIKIYAPEIQVTLIESNQKKATFLRELTRALTLTNVNVFHGRAENYPNQANLVTLRAVEQFETTIKIAVRLAAPKGHMALLIGESQLAHLPPTFAWSPPIPIPLSSSRVLAIGLHEP
jgi:16S rRNA (guanine527-N7)-methyltransferase